MDEKFVPAVIYDADRVVITAALLRRGSNARNVPLQLASFGNGRQVWPNREPSLAGRHCLMTVAGLCSLGDPVDPATPLDLLGDHRPGRVSS